MVSNTKELEIRRGRKVVYTLYARLVFVTKYRHGFFSKEILDQIKSVFESVCLDFESQLIEFNGGADYVHILVRYPPKVSLSKLVNSLKGVSSRRVKQKQYPHIQEYLSNEMLWSPNYFVSSCGNSSLDDANHYIEKQKGLVNFLPAL